MYNDPKPILIDLDNMDLSNADEVLHELLVEAGVISE